MGVLDEPDDMEVVHLNNIVLFGDKLDKLWEASVRVIYKLTIAKFILNNRKSEFLVSAVRLLGFFMSRGMIKLHFK